MELRKNHSFGTPGDPSVYLNILEEQNDQDLQTEYQEYLEQGLRIHQKIRGGMAEVFICSDEKDNLIAMKSFQKRFYFNPLIRTSFLQEALIWSQLTGTPFIFPLFSIHQIKDRYFLDSIAVLPDQQGNVTLRDFLSQSTLSTEIAFAYAYQIISGLFEAQKTLPTIVHGDLKPENILLWKNMLWITDFGLAKIQNEISNNFSISLETTWAYKAPELWLGENTSILTDIYALGIIIFELFFGQLPFVANDKEGWRVKHTMEEPNIVQLDSDTKTEVYKFCLKCMQKIPSQRPQNFDQILNFLQTVWKKFSEHNYKETKKILDNKQISFMHSLFGIKKSLIKNLISFGENKLALSQFNILEKKYTFESSPLFSRNPDSLDNMLFLKNILKTMSSDFIFLKGLVLSLNNQEEKALEHFQEAINLGFESSEELFNCQIEQALAHRRLGKLVEAEQLFLNILNECSEKQLSIVYPNLAITYLDQGKYETAINILIKAELKTPEAYGVKINLGMAYLEINDFQKARFAFQRAISCKPPNDLVYLKYAEASFLNGDFMEVFNMLKFSENQGYEISDQWAAIMLATLKKASTPENYQNFILWINRDTSPDMVKHIIDKQTRLLKQYETKIYKENEVATIQPKETEKSANSKDDDSLILNGSSEFQMPFVVPRYYISEGVYSIDVYYPIESEDYTNVIKKSLYSISRNPEITNLKLTLSEVPFYFTVCPNCSISIITNRTINRNIRCRRCDEHFTTQNDLERNPQLFSGILEKLEMPVSINGLGTVFIVFQAGSDKNIPIIDSVCKHYEFKPVSGHTIGYKNYLIRLTTRIPNFNPFLQDFKFYKKVIKFDFESKKDTTPPDVEIILREIRKKADEPFLSFSGDYDHTDELERLRYEDDLGLLKYLENALQRNSSDIELNSSYLSVLSHLERNDEALKVAKKILALLPDKALSWANVGWSYNQTGDFKEAIRYLEKALEMDPVQITAISGLVKCYYSLGEYEKARELIARLKNLGYDFSNPSEL